jgi:hypothetical protein
MSMKNSNNTIGNRTCDLPAFSAVPQPSALPRAPYAMDNFKNKIKVRTEKQSSHFRSFVSS